VVSENCPDCGDEYDRLGNHWRYNPSHRPNLTDLQEQIITGLLMGDGSVVKVGNRKPHVQCEMVSENYLEYIDDVFGCLSTGVRLKHTADENSERVRKSGFNINAKKENYSDTYYWCSRKHPELAKYRDWYSTGKKIWPEDIELTPIVLKHWYCGDGHLNDKDTAGYIQIAMANEVENRDKVNSFFTSVGLPSPSNYSITERESGSNICQAYWTVDQSYELWEYMGNPLPDFEYKWPEQYR